MKIKAMDLLEDYRRHLVSIEIDEPGNCPACSPDTPCVVHRQLLRVKEAVTELGAISGRLAAADEVAAQLARLEKHYIFGDEEYCDWCEAPPHADGCPFAVLTRGEGKTIEPALTAADALAAVLVLGNQAIKGAIQHVPPTVENHEWLALAAIVEERADAALRAYHEARGGE